MRITSCILAVLAALIVAGCNSSAGTTIDGRDVEIISPPGHTTSVRDFNNEYAILTVAGYIIKVTKNDLSWSDDEVIALPPDWKHLELKERGRRVDVWLDGRQFDTIGPA